MNSLNSYEIVENIILVSLIQLIFSWLIQSLRKKKFICAFCCSFWNHFQYSILRPIFLWTLWPLTLPLYLYCIHILNVGRKEKIFTVEVNLWPCHIFWWRLIWKITRFSSTSLFSVVTLWYFGHKTYTRLFEWKDLIIQLSFFEGIKWNSN